MEDDEVMDASSADNDNDNDNDNDYAQQEQHETDLTAPHERSDENNDPSPAPPAPRQLDVEPTPSSPIASTPALTGTLLHRPSRTAKSALSAWKSSMRTYTVLDMAGLPSAYIDAPSDAAAASKGGASGGATSADAEGVAASFTGELNPSSVQGMVGSLLCYRFQHLTKKQTNAAYTTTELQSNARREKEILQSMQRTGNVTVCLDIPADWSWTVRDVMNDATGFVVEVPVEEAMRFIGSQSGSGGGMREREDVPVSRRSMETADEEDEDQEKQDNEQEKTKVEQEQSDDESDYDEDEEEDDDGMYVFWGGDEADDEDENDGNIEDDEAGEIEIDDSNRSSIPSGRLSEMVAPNQVELDVRRASARGRPYVRYAFRCPSKRNEKALWLKAFAKCNRLASESSRRRGLFGSASTAGLSVSVMRSNSRIRTSQSAEIARQSTRLEKDAMGGGLLINEEDNVEVLASGGVKEYRVRPNYAYMHRWMTKDELVEEMMLPSSEVHDLRLPPAVAPVKEVAMLQVDVLQCLGLPRPKGKTAGTSVDPNTVVYLVSGQYAFATDVITQCQNPIWLKSMRRSCAIPIHHGYARMYAGVFHDDGSKSSKDLFIGRAVLEVARLRPGVTYDVVIPLRLSNQVYTRRKRGAIRLRFTLDIKSEKQLVLSYLPSKRNKLGGQAGIVTVAAADPKGFRNVALTVHGIHMPGKFSTDHFMAIIREFKFVQKIIQRLLKKFVEDLVVWRYPLKSAFVFLAWMHSVYINSATLIPVYIASFVLMLLLENYARVVVAGAEYRPATWEEIFAALTKSSKPSEKSNGYIHAPDGIVDTYRPVGESLFSLVGFIGKNDEYFDGNKDMFSQEEFPYASLAGYPRMFVNDAVNAATIGAEIAVNDDADDNENDMMQEESVATTDFKGEEYQPRIPFKKRIPQQNMDLKVKGDGKSIADELQEIEGKIQKATNYAFKDQTYIITNSDMPVWGKRVRDASEEELRKDLDKLLGIGQFSQWNPIVGKMTAQFEPIVRICVVFLSLYRSIYNLFTWRDPYLSFWFSLACVLGIAATVLFPWRPVLFVVGVVALGPQNWVVRLFRELVWSNGNKDRPGRFLRAFRELLKSGDEAKEDVVDLNKVESFDEGAPQPIFYSHNPASKPLMMKPKTKGAQHVLVPQSALFSQRFYDFPPDPKFSRVYKSIKGDPSALRSSPQQNIVAKTKIRVSPSDTAQQSSPKQIRQQNEETKSRKSKASAPPQLPKLSPKGSPSKEDSIRNEPRIVGSQNTSPQWLTEKTGARSIGEGNRELDKSALARTITSTAKMSITEKARKMGSMSKSLAKKGLRKSVNFDEDLSLTSGRSGDNISNKMESAGKKVGRLVKRTIKPGVKSKKGTKIREGMEIAIAVPEEVGDAGWLKMPSHDESPSNVHDNEIKSSADSSDEIDVTEVEDEKAMMSANELAANEPEETKEVSAKSGGEMGSACSNDVAGTGITAPTADDTSNEKTVTLPEGTRVVPLSAEQSPKTSGRTEISSVNDNPFMLDNRAQSNSIVGTINDTQNNALTEDISTTDAGTTDKDESASNLENADSSDSSRDDTNPSFAEDDPPPPTSNGISTAIESATDSNGISSSPLSPPIENDAAALLSTLMEVKLELATARTENDHYRAQLQETEAERDYYRDKYNACLEKKESPDDINSTHSSPRSFQSSAGFKFGQISTPFRKQTK